MLNIKIRLATKHDSTDFLKLVSAFARFVHKAPLDASARRRILRDLFSRQIHVLLALLGEKPVGYALYYYTYASFEAQPVLYLEDLYVSDRFRSKGIGHSLFKACAKQAIQQGCGRMEWNVLTWNRRAIDYYEKLGARRLKELYYYRLTSNQLKRLSSKGSRGIS